MIPGRKNTGKECIIPERIKDIITEPAGNGKEKSDLQLKKEKKKTGPRTTREKSG